METSPVDVIISSFPGDCGLPTSPPGFLLRGPIHEVHTGSDIPGLGTRGVYREKEEPGRAKTWGLSRSSFNRILPLSTVRSWVSF